MKHIFLFSLWAALFLSGCASQNIIREKEYEPALGAFKKGDYKTALEQFPEKEQGGFVTSVEKGWIRFWNGDTALPIELQKQVSTFEERKFISLHKEAGYFFYQEDEQGYVPAEHEVIVLHLLSAMAYMRSQKWDDAKVEARRAGYYLQGLFNENQPHFDDPSLRVWLAGIWAALGEWPEAQVDLRRAYEVTKDKRLLKYIEQQKPPKQMSLILYGVAPELRWTTTSRAPEFIAKDIESDWQFDTYRKDKNNIYFTTHGWFARHAQRDSELRDVLLKSNYMAQFMGVEGTTFAGRAGSKLVSSTIKALGVVVGVAIVGGGLYMLAASSGGGEAAGYIVGAGFVFGSMVWRDAEKLDDSLQEKLDESEKNRLADLHNYRLVRFLPDQVIVNFSDISPKVGSVMIDLHAPGSGTVTTLIHVPR